METEHLIGKLRQSRGDHTSHITQERQFLALCTVEDQLNVIHSNWAEWRKEAAQQAEKRRNSPSSHYPALLQAALEKQKLHAGKHPRLNTQANKAAGRAAQQRQLDPAAARVQLVHSMRCLKLKRAALLALLQSEQQQGRKPKQQQLEHDTVVQKLNLAQVTAQMLVARWTTEQLTLAHATAQRAAQGTCNMKKLTKASKKQQQEQQQEQQQKQQQEWQELAQQQQETGESQAAPVPMTALAPCQSPKALVHPHAPGLP